MASADRVYRILWRDNDAFTKLCTIILGKDGSYYVTSPYHPIDEAYVHRMRIRYGKHGEDIRIPKEHILEYGFLKDVQNNLKLAHHPDGFIHFSGRGLRSGKDENGVPKGLGVQAWPLSSFCAGPAFGMSIVGMQHFKKHDAKETDNLIIFDSSDFSHEVQLTTFVVEGHYFPGDCRQFIYPSSKGGLEITKIHPTGLSMPLRVLLPDPSCALRGFIGLRMYPHENQIFRDCQCGFHLGSSAGNEIIDEQGVHWFEQLYCFYPKLSAIEPDHIQPTSYDYRAE
jgi:hypothetical protein